MRIVLAADGPLDARATLARYCLWGEDPANRVEDGLFLRVLRLDGRLVPYDLRWSGPVDDTRLVVTVPGERGERVAQGVVREVRRILGLDFDLAGFYRLAKADGVLASLVGPLHGLRPTLAPTALEMLVGAITAQQVNLRFAFALRAEVVRRHGTPVAIGGRTVHAFPEAAVLAGVPLEEFRAMKFSTRKAEYVRDSARAVAEGVIDLASLEEAPSAAIVDLLTARRGLGLWTAEWFLARCLGRGDVCPAGDLGVRKAFEHYYGRGRRLEEAAIRRRARAWGPYQNLAIHYLLAGRRLEIPVAGGGT